MHQSDKSHHYFAGASGSDGSHGQYMNLPGRGSQQTQENIVATAMPSGSTVHIDHDLTVDSRIQISTHSPAEPFKYGVIRWIGEIPAIQGLVAGIELVSTFFLLTYVYMYVYM